MAPKLVYFVLKKELLNYSEIAPSSLECPFMYCLDMFGGKLAPKLVYFVLKKELLNFSEAAPLSLECPFM